MSRELFQADGGADTALRIRRLEARVVRLEEQVVRLAAALAALTPADQGAAKGT